MMYRIMLLVFFLSPLYSQAQSIAGKTMVARGTVLAKSEQAEQDARPLKRRSPIYNNDVVETGAKAKAQLRMTDGGMIALKENSQLVISDYQFSDANGRGSVVMELVKGGLRSVTGAIKAESGDYKLKTPVGSIGIRGTHYEVEIVGKTIWVAVWDGAVDIAITAGDTAGSTLSLGADEGYSYASVDQSGKVSTYIEPPEAFKSGMSSEADDIDQTDEEEQTEQEQTASTSVSSGAVAITVTTEEDNNSSDPDDNDSSGNATEEADVETSQQIASDAERVNTALVNDESFIATDDFNAIETTSIEELLAQRSGSFTYNQLANSDVISSAGSVNDFKLSMTIDFDKGAIPGGQMSFNDEAGEWFATFDGVINIEQIDLDITFASHGNNLADGDINASFFDGLNSIVGEFTLAELLNPDVKAKGSFLLK